MGFTEASTIQTSLIEWAEDAGWEHIGGAELPGVLASPGAQRQLCVGGAGGLEPVEVFRERPQPLGLREAAGKIEAHPPARCVHRLHAFWWGTASGPGAFAT